MSFTVCVFNLHFSFVCKTLNLNIIWLNIIFRPTKCYSWNEEKFQSILFRHRQKSREIVAGEITTFTLSTAVTETRTKKSFLVSLDRPLKCGIMSQKIWEKLNSNKIHPLSGRQLEVDCVALIQISHFKNKSENNCYFLLTIWISSLLMFFCYQILLLVLVSCWLLTNFKLLKKKNRRRLSSVRICWIFVWLLHLLLFLLHDSLLSFIFAKDNKLKMKKNWISLQGERIQTKNYGGMINTLEVSSSLFVMIILQIWLSRILSRELQDMTSCVSEKKKYSKKKRNLNEKKNKRREDTKECLKTLTCSRKQGLSIRLGSL